MNQKMKTLKIGSIIKFIYQYFFIDIAEGVLTWPSEISAGLLNSAFDKNFYYLAANETVADLKAEQIVPENVYFRFQQISACDDFSSVNGSLQLWFYHNASIIFGPECSEGMIPTALMGASFNKPIVGYASITSDLSNKTKYSTLVRLSNTMTSMSKAISTVLVYYNWKNVSIVQSQKDCKIFLSGLEDELVKMNISVTNNLDIDFWSVDSVKNALMILQATARVIILCNGPAPSMTSDFLKAADKAGMNTPDFVYVTPYFAASSLSPWEPWLQPNVDVSEANDHRNAYRNTLIISTKGEMSWRFKEFSNRLKTISSNNADQYSSKFNEDYMLRLGQFRDAIYLYGFVLNKSIANGLDIELGTKFFQATINTIIGNGVTGKIILDNNAERVPSYYVSKFNKSGVYETILLLAAVANNTHKLGVTSVLAVPFWNTTENLPPDDVPSCEFGNEFCPTDTSYIRKLAIGIPIALSVVLATLFIIISAYRKNIFERQLLQMTWRIDSNELASTLKPLKDSFLTNSLFSYKRSTNSNCINVARSDTGMSRKFGVYKGIVVAIKQWPRNSHTILSRDHLLRLKCIKEMNHENINKFIGFSVDIENFVVSLWPYCSRRSLQEVVYNEDVHLDTTFKVSILRDIISGLHYLHSSTVEYHGSLYITNCVVDNRWLVKLTDFGLQPILNELCEKKIIDLSRPMDMDKLLCTAPEILRNSSPKNLKPSDIYQFAMVAYHVLYRETPFADSHLTADDILTILTKESGKTTVRPTLKNIDNFDCEIKDLISLCWQENVTVRPTASELKKQIFSRTKSFGKNVMDHMMTMLEKYATNLEKIVDERTIQLHEERNRADHLLFQMLPKSIAEALKNGVSVSPETFNCVTVFFSDIVGFTNICSNSTPVEVVSMLNILYSHFDAIILQFNCYKVETIGDAYLVVSGLPKRNGDQHVGQIADMSLEISTILKTFEVPHIPGRLLQIRIGIHSGPVAAGVVGLTLPKYCLFGDTVNFASRMESTGEPGKIHITENTKNLLDRQQVGYLTIRRGNVDIKGKGACTTYWLLGKTDEK